MANTNSVGSVDVDMGESPQQGISPLAPCLEPLINGTAMCEELYRQLNHMKGNIDETRVMTQKYECM